LFTVFDFMALRTRKPCSRRKPPRDAEHLYR